MNQTKSKVQQNKIMREIYDYSKELQTYGTAGGVISIGMFFCTKMFYILATSTITYWVYRYPRFMKFSLIASILYTLALVLLIGIKYYFQDYSSVKQNKTILSFMKSVACLLLFPYELSVYGVKSILIITYSFRSSYRDLFLENDGSAGPLWYIIMVAIYLDFAISIIICFLKSTVLRPLIPNGGFFSKVDGNFEYFFILLIPLKHLFFFLTVINDKISVDGIVPGPRQWIFFSVEVSLMIIISFIYFKELPYYHPMSERFIAHFLISTSCVFLLLGILKGDLNSTFKIYLFVVPVQVAGFEYFLKRVYCINYMDPRQTATFQCLKKIMIIDKTSNDLFDKTYNQGVFMNYIKTRKVLSDTDKAMWRNIQNFKPDENFEDEESKLTNLDKETEAHEAEHSIRKLVTEGKLHNSMFGGTSTHNEYEDKNSWDDSRETAQQKKTKLEQLIINAYTDQNRKIPYAFLIRIHWMLTSRVVIFNLFSDLRSLLELATSLKSKFVYYYALKEVEAYLSKFYQNPEMINLEAGRGRLIGTSNKNLKNSGVLDLAYAFYHKYTVQHMKTLIETFADKNKKFMEEMSMSATSYKKIHERVKELHKMDCKIKGIFQDYHTGSKTAENEHILPYCVHLCYNVNFLRSGKNLLGEYIKRNALIQRIHEERNPNLVPEQVLIDTIILLVDSDFTSLGTILDVYGDTTALLDVNPKNLIGKDPNFLLPTCMTKYHHMIMKDYLTTPLRYFMGLQRESFIKMPETKFIHNCNINLKLSPNMGSGFKILLAVKPNQKKYNQKIILNDNFEVDCYSYNFLTTLEEDMLLQFVPIAKLSPDLFSYIVQGVKEFDRFKGDISKFKERQKILDNFKRYVQKELGKTSPLNRRNRNPSRFTERDDDSERNFTTATDLESQAQNSNIFELRFESDAVNFDPGELYKKAASSGYFETEEGVKKRVEKRVFEINLEVKEFVNVKKRLYYLDMTLLDENDQKQMTVKKVNSRSTNRGVGTVYGKNADTSVIFGEKMPAPIPSSSTIPHSNRGSSPEASRDQNDPDHVSANHLAPLPTLSPPQAPPNPQDVQITIRQMASSPDPPQDSLQSLSPPSSPKLDYEGAQLDEFFTDRSAPQASVPAEPPKEYRFFHPKESPSLAEKPPCKTLEHSVFEKHVEDATSPDDEVEAFMAQQNQSVRRISTIKKSSAITPLSTLKKVGLVFNQKKVSKSISKVKTLARWVIHKKRMKEQLTMEEKDVELLKKAGNIENNQMITTAQEYLEKNKRPNKTSIYGIKSKDGSLPLTTDDNVLMTRPESPDLGTGRNTNLGTLDTFSKGKESLKTDFIKNIMDNMSRHYPRKPQNPEGNSSSTMNQARDIKKCFNFEDAIKKKLSLPTITFLIAVNLLVILGTLLLTAAQGQIIVSQTESVITDMLSIKAFSSSVGHVSSSYNIILLRWNRLSPTDPLSPRVLSSRYNPMQGWVWVEKDQKFQTTKDIEEYLQYAANSQWDIVEKSNQQLLSQRNNDFTKLMVSKTVDIGRNVDDRGIGEYKTSLFLGYSYLINVCFYSALTLDRPWNIDDVELSTILFAFLRTFAGTIEKTEYEAAKIPYEVLKRLEKIALILFGTNLAFLLFGSISSILLVCTLLSRFKAILNCTKYLQLKEVEERLDQLQYVMDTMEKTTITVAHLSILSDTVDPLSLSYAQAKDEKSATMAKKKRAEIFTNNQPGRSAKKGSNIPKKSLYCFNLMASVLILVGFYLGQLVFSGSIVLVFENSNIKNIQLIESQLSLIKLSNKLNLYMNAISDLMTVGTVLDDQANKKVIWETYIKTFEEKETTDSSELEDLASTVARSFALDNSEATKPLREKFLQIMNKNICDGVEKFESVKFLCLKLDNGIPERGMLSAYFRIKKMFSSLIAELRSGKDPKEVLNNEEYINFEFTFQTIYSETNLYMINAFFDFIDGFLKKEVGNVKTLIAITMVFLVVFSTAFTVLTFRDIFRVKDELAFSFQIAPLNGIVENQKIRVVFQRLFKLDNQYFS